MKNHHCNSEIINAYDFTCLCYINRTNTTFYLSIYLCAYREVRCSAEGAYPRPTFRWALNNLSSLALDTSAQVRDLKGFFCWGRDSFFRGIIFLAGLWIPLLLLFFEKLEIPSFICCCIKQK